MTILPNREMKEKDLVYQCLMHKKGPKGTPGKQYILKGTYSARKSRQAQFVYGQRGESSKSLLNSDKLPELRFPAYNFTGPGNKIERKIASKERKMN